MRRAILLLTLISAFFASCEKAEDALVLPPTGTATHGMLDMGKDYDKQFYFDFKTGAPVFASDPTSWHLAFESYAGGRHVYMNGGNEVYVYNTHELDMDKVLTLPAGLGSNGSGWQYDAPSGNPDSTGIGNWYHLSGETKGEVYIVQLEPDRNVKMRVLYVDDRTFRFEWEPLANTGSAQNVELTKDEDYNFIYYSFDKGVVQPEPPKDSWDVVFTRYRYVFHTQDYPNFPYEVTGVLLNPTNTLGTADSVHSFEQIDLQLASTLTLTARRDIIGFDWKGYNGTSGRYAVNRGKNYLIQTRDKQLYKLHFLDFYNSSGVKGSPSFEFERLK